MSNIWQEKNITDISNYRKIAIGMDIFERGCMINPVELDVNLCRMFANPNQFINISNGTTDINIYFPSNTTVGYTGISSDCPPLIMGIK